MDTVKHEVNSGQMIHTIYLYAEGGTDRYGNPILVGPVELRGRWMPGTSREAENGIVYGDSEAQCILPDLINREIEDVDGVVFTLDRWTLSNAYINPFEDVDDPETEAHPINQWHHEISAGGVAGQIMVFL